MDFRDVNRLNVRLNMISGNLLPMTSDDAQFPIAWRIYSSVIWLIKVIHTIAMILGVLFVTREKALADSTVTFVVAVEIIFLFARLHAHRDLASRLIRMLNDILRVQDETMQSIVRSTLKPVDIPLKLYGMAGCVAILIWCSMPFALLFKKKYFFYEDCRIALVFSKQPFSREVFLLGNVVTCIYSVYLFIKKVALDVYMINLVLLITVQYRYITVKLTAIFQNVSPKKQYAQFRDGDHYNVDQLIEKEIKALCRHHNIIVNMTPILKKLLSVNLSMIYLSSIFRFCFLGIMLICTIPSAMLVEALMVMMYICGGLVQLYILCSSVHQLFEASTEMTDKSFHGKWYLFLPSLKRTFLLIIISNNLECKLSALEKLNLSLSSFMTILNHSYSIALLFLKMR